MWLPPTVIHSSFGSNFCACKSHTNIAYVTLHSFGVSSTPMILRVSVLKILPHFIPFARYKCFCALFHPCIPCVWFLDEFLYSIHFPDTGPITTPMNASNDCASNFLDFNFVLIYHIPYCIAYDKIMYHHCLISC